MRGEWIIFNAINRSCGDFLIGSLTPDALSWDYADYKLDEFVFAFYIKILKFLKSFNVVWWDHWGDGHKKVVEDNVKVFDDSI